MARRNRQKQAGVRPVITSSPYIDRKIGPLPVLSEEGLELIEANAERILLEIGMEFRDDPEVIEIFSKAGCDIDGERVRFKQGFCRQIITTHAPAEFTQLARNPELSVKIGGNSSVLCPSWGPPFVHDETGDAGMQPMMTLFVRKAASYHPIFAPFWWRVCEPVDLPANKRHLDMLYAHIRWSDRPFMGAFIGSERAGHSIDMARIVFGADVLEKQPVLYCVSNTNAPLVMDANMSGALKTYARANQPVACTPWTLTGAMSPTTIAGTLSQVLAEALASLTLVQLVNPGAPALMGSFASTMSMQSGAPTFGTPEAGQMILAAGQLARRLGVPLHTVGTLSASKIADAQSQQEGTWGLIMSLFAGANVINHATGWLEGGLVTSFEKTMMDADLCGKLCRFFEGIDLSENAQAMDAIAATGPGQHFLGSEHTQANFLTALFRPDLADNNSYEQWQADGQLGMTQRANALWKDRLEKYQDPGLAKDIDDALQDYVRQKKEKVPDADFF